MDLFIEILVDFALVAGIVLIVLSARKKYTGKRVKFLIAGLCLAVAGLVFIDWQELRGAYQEGYD